MEKKREIDPVILAAAKGYEERFSECTPMTHYLVVWRDAVGENNCGVCVHKEHAQSWAYEVDGECFSVNPIDGKNGALVEHVKRITQRQWRSMQMGRRMKS